jgi:hypothetical protein
VSPTDGRFDDLARGLAEGPVSRRRAVKVMGGAVLATALAALGFGREANAAPCPAPGIKCHGSCCVGGQQCVGQGAGSSCQCPTGQIFCDGQCVTGGSDNENCGFCGNDCTQIPNSSCVGGSCQCDAGFVFCGGECVSTACDTGEQFDFSTCSCVPSGGGGGCAGPGDNCTSHHDCCNADAQCKFNDAEPRRKVCTA